MIAVHIHKCPCCTSYTMEKEHCKRQALLARPPKFSLEDKYGDMRRDMKKKGLQERGLY